MFDEKNLRLNFTRGLWKLTKSKNAIYEPNILKIIHSFIPTQIIDTKIPSLMDFKPKTGIEHTTVILEYYKRIGTDKYLLFQEYSEIWHLYNCIVEMLKFTITDVPYTKSELLIYLIKEYIRHIEEKDYITQDNISKCNYILQQFCLDTEAFLESIYYIFRYPQWNTNHQFIVDYVQNRLGKSYYFC